MTQERRQHPWYRVHVVLNRAYDSLSFPRLAKVFRGLSYASGALTATTLAVLEFTDRQQHIHADLLPIIDRIFSHRLGICTTVLLLHLLILAAAGLLSYFASSVDGSKVELVLKDLVRSHFPDQKLSEHHYRATLFRVRQGWFFGKWLGAVARPGHLYVAKKSVFSIDPQIKLNNTGYAGECWRASSCDGVGEISSPDPLPNVRKQDRTEADLAAYQAKGYITDLEFGRMSVHACLFWAVSISVDGTPWGVLVIDTTDPDCLFKRGTVNDNRQKASRSSAAFSLQLLIR